MAKPVNIFSCSHCGAQFQKWVGRCLECGQWGTIEKKLQSTAPRDAVDYEKISLTPLSQITSVDTARLHSGIAELDRVLGGGIVPGSLILLGGEPGIGKSTLSLQMAGLFDDVIYVSGEENPSQIKMRAARLGIKSAKLRVASETIVEKITAAFADNPKLVIIDSIQTVSSLESEGSAGSPTQMRAAVARLMESAKKSSTAVVIIGQVTKDGNVAGPKTIEHLVDTVLYLEGDRFHQYRILRAVKNRFGNTDEVGIFSMEETGLTEVANPSQMLLRERPPQVAGSAVACLMEGARPMLIEIQALVTRTAFGYPVRRAVGFDLNRLQVLIGVLTRRAALPLDGYDVYLNVVGGMSADEPAADLAVALALASGFIDKTLPADLCVFGEVGLGGEIRAVSHPTRRLEEIKKLGFNFAVVPAQSEQSSITGLKIAPIKNIKEVIERVLK